MFQYRGFSDEGSEREVAEKGHLCRWVLRGERPKRWVQGEGHSLLGVRRGNAPCAGQGQSHCGFLGQSHKPLGRAHNYGSEAE